MSKRKEDVKEPENSESRELWLDDSMIREISSGSSNANEEGETAEEEKKEE